MNRKRLGVDQEHSSVNDSVERDTSFKTNFAYFKASSPSSGQPSNTTNLSICSAGSIGSAAKRKETDLRKPDSEDCPSRNSTE